MFEVGQVFEKNGFEYCIIDILEMDNHYYALMSVEDGNIEYAFFEIKRDSNGFNLEYIENDELNFKLFSLEEARNNAK